MIVVGCVCSSYFFYVGQGFGIFSMRNILLLQFFRGDFRPWKYLLFLQKRQISHIWPDAKKQFALCSPRKLSFHSGRRPKFFFQISLKRKGLLNKFPHDSYMEKNG